jgi:hypothetical protein
VASVRSPEVGAALLADSWNRVTLVHVDAGRGDDRPGPGIVPEPESGLADAPVRPERVLAFGVEPAD